MAKTFTLRDVAQALIDDPTPKATHAFFTKKAGHSYAQDEIPADAAISGVITEDAWGRAVSPEDAVIGATCALGGAALGLSVHPEQLQSALMSIECDMGYRTSRLNDLGFYGPHPLGELIYTLNDSVRISKKALGERILKYCVEFLDVKMTAEEVEYHAKVAGGK